MGSPDPAAVNPATWGIVAGHHRIDGQWIDSPPVGVAAALEAMGADGEPPASSTWVIDRRRGLDIPFAADLRTEDGNTQHVAGFVPPDALPLGYHWLEPSAGGDPVRLIVSPGICPRPRRSWGWSLQLYATRSRASWGIGDLADLRILAATAPHLLINPLHAVAPTAKQQPSPYMPASRRWRNPIYLRIEEVPGAPGLVDAWASAARALNTDRVIDRDRVWQFKRAALEAVWDAARPGRELDDWIAEQGTSLVGFATWAALCDDHGPDWRGWPVPLQTYASPMVKSWSSANRDHVMFHAWLQWLLSAQVDAAARAGATIAGDLAIGCDPGGADAWEWRDVLADGVTIGAPPDDFNPHGQEWGMPPFDPWRLRAAGYAPFVEIVRAAFAGLHGVRLDHVAGLFRTYWVPAGGDATDGVYVRYPWEDLLNIVALEAERAGAFVVGEDLGTIEPEVRHALAARNVLSYRVLWFENDDPSTWPELTLASVTTHDLPTLAGVWQGSDGADLRSRLERIAPGAHDLPSVVRRAYAGMSAAPPLLVLGCLEDVVEMVERPNHPGTTDPSNWSLALPEPIDDLVDDERLLAATAALRR
jgi:4-alpha-glucanotransferase